MNTQASLTAGFTEVDAGALPCAGDAGYEEFARVLELVDDVLEDSRKGFGVGSSAVIWLEPSGVMDCAGVSPLPDMLARLLDSLRPVLMEHTVGFVSSVFPARSVVLVLEAEKTDGVRSAISAIETLLNIGNRTAPAAFHLGAVELSKHYSSALDVFMEASAKAVEVSRQITGQTKGQTKGQHDSHKNDQGEIAELSKLSKIERPRSETVVLIDPSRVVRAVMKKGLKRYFPRTRFLELDPAIHRCPNATFAWNDVQCVVISQELDEGETGLDWCGYMAEVSPRPVSFFLISDAPSDGLQQAAGDAGIEAVLRKDQDTVERLAGRLLKK